MATMTAAPALRQLPNFTTPGGPPTTPNPSERTDTPATAGGGVPLGGTRRIDESVRCEFHARLISSLDLSKIGTRSDDELRAEIRTAAEELCRQSANVMSAAEREQLVNEVMDETFGLGPLETLLRDPTISDILINGPKVIFCERRGRLEKSDVTFASEEHLLQIIQRIVSRVGRRVDATSPMVDARLADGSRVNAIIPPLALDGSLVSIRRFPARPLKAEDLIAKKSCAAEMIEFLQGAVKARQNILI